MLGELIICVALLLHYLQLINKLILINNLVLTSGSLRLMLLQLHFIVPIVSGSSQALIVH